MPTRLRFAVLSLVPLVASCTGGLSDDASSTTPDGSVAAPTTTDSDASTTGGGGGAASGFEPAPLTWESCSRQVDCATLVVPLDHADPTGETIELALARRQATGPGSRIGVLLVNPGGPGGSGVDLVTSGYDLTDGLAQRFDIVGWDPRGVGASTRVHCDRGAMDDYLAADPSPDDRAEEDAIRAAAAELAETCGEGTGELLGHVGGRDVAEDMDLIRRALGEDTISYYGFSYGTVLGQVYLDLHPEGVRALVLDGVVDTDRVFADQARIQMAGFSAGLDELFAACQRDPSCPLDDIATTYDTVAELVENQPLPAPGGEVTPAVFHTAVVSAGYSPSSWPVLWQALAAAADGDGRLLRLLADEYYGFGAFDPYFAVSCTDWPHPDEDGYTELARELQAEDPRIGASFGYELLVCAHWPVDVDPLPRSIDGDGAPPVLVIGNTGDTATPYATAVTVAGRLDGAGLLTYDGEGHTSLNGNRCVDEAVERYLIDLELPAPDARC